MHYSDLAGALNVSKIALGTWALGDTTFWGDQDEKLSHETIARALDCGINFIDTAEAYGGGLSEEVVGRALKGRRDKAVLATKAYGESLRAANMEAALDASLKRLQTDFIDLYYVHWPLQGLAHEETWQAFSALKQKGKIGHVAICNFGPQNLAGLAAIDSSLLAAAPPLAHQLPYSLFWRAIESTVMPATRDLGMGVVAYSGLAQGLLSGQFNTIDDVPEHLKVTRYYRDSGAEGGHGEAGTEAEVFAAIGQIRRLSDETGYSLPQLAIGWLLSQPDVKSVLVGARSPKEVDENAQAMSLSLNADILDTLTAISAPIRARLGDNPDMWLSQEQSRFV